MPVMCERFACACRRDPAKAQNVTKAREVTNRAMILEDRCMRENSNARSTCGKTRRSLSALNYRDCVVLSHGKSFRPNEMKLPALRPGAVYLREKILRHRLQWALDLDRFGEHFAGFRQLVHLAIGKTQSVERAGVLLIVLAFEQGGCRFEFRNGRRQLVLV